VSADDPWIAMALAEAYRRRGKPEEAEAEYKRAIALDSELHQARLNLSALYIHLERYEDAIPHLVQLADDPTFSAPWRALTNLGWAQYRLGRRAEARSNLQTARARPDAHAEANYRMAEIHVSLGQRQQALDRLQSAASGPGDGPWSRRSEEYLELLR
jgi:Tfp pilus assembly protein PilF